MLTLIGHGGTVGVGTGARLGVRGHIVIWEGGGVATGVLHEGGGQAGCNRVDDRTEGVVLWSSLQA